MIEWQDQDLFKFWRGSITMPIGFNISHLIPFAGRADIEEEELTDLRSNPL